jgi:hypothetical protein
LANERAFVTAVWQIQDGKRITTHLDVLKQTGGSPAAWTEAQLLDFADALQDGFTGTPDLAAQYSPSVILDHCEAAAYSIVSHSPTPTNPCLWMRDVGIGPVASVGPPAPGEYPGTDGALPPNVAWRCTFRTATVSRRGHGGFFMPPPPESKAFNTGIVNPAWVTSQKDKTDDWIDGALNAAGVGDAYIHVLFSCMDGVTRPVTSRVYRARIDTQRRRLQREV